MSLGDRLTRRAPKPGLPVLIAISWVSPMGINISLPSIPTIEKALGAPYATVTLLISLYMLGMAACQLFLGPISDKYGRRPVVLIGLSCAFVAGLVCAFAQSIEVLIAARVVQGMGACAGIVLARAIVRDISDRRRAASMLGYVTMGMAVAPMVAPLIGGILDDAIGWRAGFFALAALTLAVTITAYFRLGETAPKIEGRTAASLVTEFGNLALQPLFWLYTSVLALTSGVYFSFLGAAPLISAEVLEISPTEYGGYFLIVAMGYITGNFLSGRYTERMGIKWMGTVGTALAIVGTAGIALHLGLSGLTAPGLFSLMVVISLANGVSMPSSIAGAVSVRPDLAGAAAGLSGSIQIGFGAFMAFLAGYLIDRPDAPADALPLIVLMLTLSVGAFLAMLPIPKQGREF